MDARLVAMAKTDWATWLAAPGVPDTCRRSLTPGDHGCLAHPSAWKPRLRTKVTHSLTLGQPDLALPWSMKGVLNGHFGCHGERGRRGGHICWAATLHLELDSVDQSVSWKGRCQLADLNDDLTGHGHVRWGGSEPEWTLNLLGQGARLFVDGRGVPEVPDMDAVLHRSAEAVVRGDMRLRGELAPKSECAAWLVPDAALLDTLSLSINVDSTDVQAQLTVPEFLWNDVVSSAQNSMPPHSAGQRQ